MLCAHNVIRICVGHCRLLWFLGRVVSSWRRYLMKFFFLLPWQASMWKIKCLHRDAMFLSGWSSESLASELFRVGLVGLWLCKTLLWVVSYEKSCHGILAVRKWKAIWWNSHGFFWNWLVDPTRLGFWLFKKPKPKKSPTKHSLTEFLLLHSELPPTLRCF